MEDLEITEEMIAVAKEVQREIAIETITEEFKTDPLYIKLHLLNLHHKLVDWILTYQLMAKQPAKLHSTKEAATLLGDGIKEYRLTNTLSREDLFGYFQVERKGAANRYLYDWKSIVRLKMAFLLADEANLKLGDIAVLVQPVISSKMETEEAKMSDEKVEQLQEKVNELLDEIANLKKHQEKEDDQEAEREKVWESRIRNVKKEQQKLEALMKEQEKSHQQTLENLVKEFDKKLGALHQSNELKIGNLYLSQKRGYTALLDIIDEYIGQQIRKQGFLSRYISAPPSDESFKTLLIKLDQERIFLSREIQELNVDEEKLFHNVDLLEKVDY